MGTGLCQLPNPLLDWYSRELRVAISVSEYFVDQISRREWAFEGGHCSIQRSEFNIGFLRTAQLV